MNPPPVAPAPDMKTALPRAVGLAGIEKGDCRWAWSYEVDYVTALTEGRPVAVGATCKPITIAVAQQLTDAERETWLRACYEYSITMMTGTERDRGTQKQQFEAIFNLTEDAELKIKAHEKWQILATEWFLEGQRSFIRAQAQAEEPERPGWRTIRPPARFAPHQTTMPRWEAETSKRRKVRTPKRR